MFDFLTCFAFLGLRTHWRLLHTCFICFPRLPRGLVVRGGHSSYSFYDTWHNGVTT